MDISLKNYKTSLPKELQKLAEKNEVRECDETKKGHYMAYVDEGKDTFDVSLILGLIVKFLRITVIVKTQ